MNQPFERDIPRTEATTAEFCRSTPLQLAATALVLTVLTLTALALTIRPARAGEHNMNMSTLTEKQKSIVPIAAFTATGSNARPVRACIRATIQIRASSERPLSG